MVNHYYIFDDDSFESTEVKKGWQNTYNARQLAYLKSLESPYRSIASGICVPSISPLNTYPLVRCRGPIGFRHAISETHLRLIANNENKIRANKEIPGFGEWLERYEGLQRVSISRFTAGKWSCQKHDEMFQGIDQKRIDLSNSENLFKAVYRVVLRQTHVNTGRWNAYLQGTQSPDDWERFKETAFDKPVTDEQAQRSVDNWWDGVEALSSKLTDLQGRLQRSEWNSLEYRVLLLESEPTVAGWGCQMMMCESEGLVEGDPRTGLRSFVDLAYMIVIPQEYGHAIITACEPNKRLRAPDVVKIHRYMPRTASRIKPCRVSQGLRGGISRKVWGLNEIGIRESVYDGWSESERRTVQRWIKDDRRHDYPLLGRNSTNLPSFF